MLRKKEIGVQSMFYFPSRIRVNFYDRLASKRDGSPRFHVDFRRLNVVMKSDEWLVPSVEEIFDGLIVCDVLKKLNLTEGYWEIEICGSCEVKNSFICGFGAY